MADYHYIRLQAKWDSIAHRQLTIRHIVFAIVALFTTWTLYSWLIRPQRFYDPRRPGRFTPGPARPWENDPNPTTWSGKAQRVKQAYLHAYLGYEQYAAPHDELLPLTNRSVDNFNGWGVSMFDSLDTMILMGLDEEFKRALPLVKATDFYMKHDHHAPFFETVIRYLGGLLSAYALSGEKILLEKADQLGGGLAHAFGTESGFPVFSVNPITGEARGNVIASLAEIASCQIEYMYLAKATGKKDYYDKANKVIQALINVNATHLGGMLPVRFNVTSGDVWDSELSVGAAADSAHEYLLKQYLQTAKTDKKSLELYLRATTLILTKLLYVSPTRKLLYVTDSYSETFVPSHRFEHLSCFFPGLLALGAHTLPLDDLSSVGISFAALGADLPAPLRAGYALLAGYSLRELHLWAAAGLAQTCALSYADARAGLGPDEMQMEEGALWVDALERWRAEGRRGAAPGTQEERPVVYSEEERVMGGKRPAGRERDYVSRKTEYLLRPETLESFYLLWRTTGDERWRQRGWDIFQAIEREARTPSGYASIKNVDFSPAPQKDDMPSFYLAETLKYLYLLFTDEDLVPLDKWVFNTEAHPLPIFEWTAAEKAKFGIR